MQPWGTWTPPRHTGDCGGTAGTCHTQDPPLGAEGSLSPGDIVVPHTESSGALKWKGSSAAPPPAKPHVWVTPNGPHPQPGARRELTREVLPPPPPSVPHTTRLHWCQVCVYLLLLSAHKAVAVRKGGGGAKYGGKINLCEAGTPPAQPGSMQPPHPHPPNRGQCPIGSTLRGWGLPAMVPSMGGGRGCPCPTAGGYCCCCCCW